MAFASDFSELFGSEKFSDVDLVIAEEALAEQPMLFSAPDSNGKRKRGDAAISEDEGLRATDQDGPARKKVIHGHRLALWGVSTFCKTKLDNWSSSTGNGTPSKPEILIKVPAGQLEIGELLIKAMYAAQPDLSGCSQSQLLQLLLLADSYGVCKVLEAVIAAISSIPDLQWDTAMAVYSLPPGCTGLDACKGLFAAAGQKLQQELGDLDLVWADRHKQQLLLQLPHRALLQLLQDAATRAASENTVFYTIERWQQQQYPEPSGDQLQLLCELVQQVRIMHCSQLYMATVVANSKIANLCFSPGELAVACTYKGAADAQVQEALSAGCLVVAQHAAWRHGARPASAMKQLVIEWQLPLEQIKGMVQQHLLDTSTSQRSNSERQVWQGQAFTLALKLSTTGDAGTQTSALGLCLHAQHMTATAVRHVTYNLQAVAAEPHAAQKNLSLGTRTHTFSKPSGTLWSKRLLAFPGLSSWSQVEAKLRELCLVHADSCLHLTAQVANIM